MTRSVAEQVRAGEITYLEGVRRGMYVPLGRGDVPVTEIVRVLQEAGYAGWYVLEQDTSLPPDDVAAAGWPRQDTADSLDHLLATVA